MFDHFSATRLATMSRYSNLTTACLTGPLTAPSSLAETTARSLTRDGTSWWQPQRG